MKNFGTCNLSNFDHYNKVYLLWFTSVSTAHNVAACEISQMKYSRTPLDRAPII